MNLLKSSFPLALPLSALTYSVIYVINHLVPALNDVYTE